MIWDRESKLGFFIRSAIYGHSLGFVRRVSIGNQVFYKVRVNSANFFVARKERLSRYIYGVDARVRRVVSSYGPPLLSLGEKLNVVDVGCNDGSFLFYFRNSQGILLGIDLEPLEIVCAKANIPRAFFLNAGAWADNGLRMFESAPNSSDSSLIGSNKSGVYSPISVITLNDLVDKVFGPSSVIDILKVEAEGAEPEVLQGSLMILDRVKYIAVDVGPERGPDELRTDEEVLKLLKEKGFDVVWMGPYENRVLLRNKNLSP